MSTTRQWLIGLTVAVGLLTIALVVCMAVILHDMDTLRSALERSSSVPEQTALVPTSTERATAASLVQADLATGTVVVDIWSAYPIDLFAVPPQLTDGQGQLIATGESVETAKQEALSISKGGQARLTLKFATVPAAWGTVYLVFNGGQQDALSPQILVRVK